MQHNCDPACSQVLILIPSKKPLYVEALSPRRLSECQHSFSKMAHIILHSIYYVDPVPETSKPPPIITKGIPKINSFPHLQRLNLLQPANCPFMLEGHK